MDGAGGLTGGFDEVLLTGEASFLAGGLTGIVGLSTGIITVPPALLMPPTGSHTASVTGVGGDLTLKDFTRADHKMVIQMNGGTLTIDSSCVDGDIDVSGIGRLIDNSNGTVVDSSAFIETVNMTDNLNRALKLCQFLALK
jgi:hypothetical protein